MSIASQTNETPAAGASRLLIRLGLLILMVVLPLAAVALRDAIYVLMPVGAVIVLAGAAVGGLEQGPRRLRTGLSSAAALTAVFLAFWAGLSLIWTPFPTEAASRFAQVLGTTLLVTLVAAWLPRRLRPFDLYILPAGLALSTLALVFVAIRGEPLLPAEDPFDRSAFDRAMITLIVLVWPALGALCLRERWILAALLALLAASVAFAGFAQVGLAAMGAGAFIFAMTMSDPAPFARIIGFGVAALILIAPGLPLLFGALFGSFFDAGHQPGATAAAMLVWNQLILAEWPRLVTGHGFDAASRTLALEFLPENAPTSLLFVIWYDLGVLGALAFAALTAQVCALVGRLPAAVAPAVLAGLGAVLVLSILGAAAAQIWWITLLACAAIAYVVLIKAIHRTHRPPAPPQDTPEELEILDLGAAPARSA